MYELVMDHRYANGMAWDVTEYRNHGLLCAVENAEAPLRPGFSFAPGRAAPGAAIVVPPSSSLAAFGAVRVRVLLLRPAPVTAGDGVLVEADGAFSITLTRDARPVGLVATAGGWAGVQGSFGVPAGEWTTVDFWYDGVSMAGIAVGGRPVASTARAADRVGALAGAVPGVGPGGLVIGHAAGPDDSRTSLATLRQVQVYKRDDLDDLRRDLDPCCPDATRAVRDRVVELMGRGVSRQDLDDQLRRLIDMCSRFVGEARGREPAGAGRYDAVARQAAHAMRRPDASRSASVLPFAEELAGRLSTGRLRAFVEEMEEFLEGAPFSRDDVESFAATLCRGGRIDALRDLAASLPDDAAWRRRGRRL